MSIQNHQPSRRERKREKEHLQRRRYWVNVQCLLVLLGIMTLLTGGAAVWKGYGQTGGARLAPTWIKNAGSGVGSFMPWHWWTAGDSVSLTGGPPPPRLLLQIAPAFRKSPDPISWSGNRALRLTTGQRIQVDIPSRTLSFWRDGERVRVYPVAVGSPATPTPLGHYVITQKERNPWWYPPPRLRQRGAAITPSGPANPLGYRWLGFGNAYGIHGTNAPWYIGAAVSNGCIRMQEADVEELFEEVDQATPLDITYESVRVSVGREGEVSMTVYPDIYGYRGYGGLESEARRQLAEQKLEGLLPEALGRQIVREQKGQAVVFARVAGFKVNGVASSWWAVFNGNELLLPLWGMVSALQLDVQWDGQKKEARYANRSVPGVLREGVVYLTPASVQGLFGGFGLWHPVERYLELAVPVLNQRYRAGNVTKIMAREPESELPARPDSPAERAASVLLRR
ncbi:MAG TPA: L,D-transpeptidase [Patescibacteria group bacterium]|nr:L,D-transpeptidase [Patescibacteria group bacterium]